MSHIPVIAISGGPCGGKSTFLVKTREWLERFDLYPLIISETATELISAGATPHALGFNCFQERLFLYSLDRERHYLEIAKHITSKRVVILCDRGIFDGKAYMGSAPFMKMIDELGFTQGELMSRYHLVIHLVTAAEGAEEFYTLSNNTARSETPEEARKLDTETQQAWLGHPHHILIDNSTDFATKMLRALRSFARTLEMPAPTEIERKFRILNFVQEFIPNEAAVSEIRQDYLVNHGPGERRVRSRMRIGESRYFYTEKLPTGERGTRIEREREIREAEYLILLRERDSKLSTIVKTRYNFLFGGKIFELDVFSGKHAGLVVLEVELQYIDEKIRLPHNWSLVEVTDDPAYKNHALAGTY